MFIFNLQFMYDFFDALITQQTSPEEAYRKFDELANKTGEGLRKLTKQVSFSILGYPWSVNSFRSNNFVSISKYWNLNLEYL